MCDEMKCSKKYLQVVKDIWIEIKELLQRLQQYLFE